MLAFDDAGISADIGDGGGGGPAAFEHVVTSSACNPARAVARQTIIMGAALAASGADYVTNAQEHLLRSLPFSLYRGRDLALGSDLLRWVRCHARMCFSYLQHGPTLEGSGPPCSGVNNL